MATALDKELEDVRFGNVVDDAELAGLWALDNDVRSFVVVGDPAARLHLGASPDGGPG